MQNIERSNLAQIEALNQRGGRTLSIVDLIRAGTISVEAAAYVGHRVSRGASLLTAANPGGAGKTALLDQWGAKRNLWAPAALAEAMQAMVPVVERWIHVTGAVGQA